MKYIIASLVILSALSFTTGFFYTRDIEHRLYIEELSEKLNAKKSTMVELLERLDRAEWLIEKAFGKPLDNKPIYHVNLTVSAYTARKQETDKTPEVTASMTPSRIGLVAISKDLENDFGWKFGDVILIEGYGLFKIEDRMNPRWKRRIDILHGNVKAAKIFGVKQVNVYWLGG